MRIGLTWRFLIRSGVFILLVAGALWGWRIPTLQRRLELEQSRALRGSASLFASWSEQQPLSQDDLDDIFETRGLDVAILNAAGETLRRSSQTPEGHLRGASSTLLETARGQGYSSYRTVDSSGRVSLIGVRALPSDSDSPEQFVWVRCERSGVLQAWSSETMLVALVLAVAALAWNAMAGGGIARTANQLVAACRSIGRGRLAGDVDVHRDDELGLLAESLGLMSREMSDRVDEARKVGAQLEAVLQGMQDAVVAIDDQLKILFANPAAQRLFGDSRSPRGKRLRELVRNRALHNAVATFFEKGEAQRIEVQWGAENRSLSVMLTEMPGGRSSGLILSFHDLTELRRLETLRQEFVANVSHELKTPLSSIKAYAETLRDGALSDPQNSTRFVQRIEEQADRLQALILDMISLARIESGKESYSIVPVRLAAAANRCVAGRHDAGARKDIELFIDKQAPRDAFVAADEEGLRQILDNLIDNAIKYTPDGGRITIRWLTSGESRWAVEVEDTGIGIPEHALPRVFERFFRVDKARARRMGGTGLGLSIVKHLTQAFGGTVSVRSTMGQGSVFRFELPRALPPSAASPL